MGRERPKSQAVVLSGADKSDSGPLFTFARGLCSASELNIMCVPGIDVALAKGISSLASPQEQHRLRDVVRTRIDAIRPSPLECVLVAKVGCNPCEEGFEECALFVMRERVELRRWDIFKVLHVACLSPNGSFTRIVPMQQR